MKKFLSSGRIIYRRILHIYEIYEDSKGTCIVFMNGNRIHVKESVKTVIETLYEDDLILNEIKANS